MIGIFYWNNREYKIEPTTISKLYPGFRSPGSTLLPHYISVNNVSSKPLFYCKVLGPKNPSLYIPDELKLNEKIVPRAKRSIAVDDDNLRFPLIDHEVVHENVIDLLIVVTSKLVKTFGKDLNEYIFNNVAIATKMLRHPSIKTSLAINVVDIISLDKDYEEMNHLDNWSLLTQDAVVDRFCHWVQHKKKYSIYDWDTAVLINEGSFSTYAIGITHLRSMCAKNNCIAVVDRGFGTGFIIAHEIGHQMNAPHDFDSIASCKNYEPVDQENVYNTIMSTSLYFEHYPFKWSQCSEHLINGFLRSNDSQCLKQKNKGPVLYLHDRIYDYHKNFSGGVRYDLNTQCTLAFGEPSEHCNSAEHMKTCSSLYCNPKRVGLCMRSQSIVDDGTPCDKNKRCIHGKCVNINSKIVPIDGDWSEFSEWSNCSRSCNGGVQFSERVCNNPEPALGGRYCIGTRIQIRSCNIHKCDKEMDIREQLCRQFGAKPYIPRNDEEPVCKLVCIKDNKSVSHDHELTDGTPCYAHGTDICVKSKCYKTGCDRVILSKKVYDNCHVCGGRNDTCTKVKKYFDGTKISPSRGMLVAFKLPKNISNIYVRKVSERYFPYSDEVYDDYQILLLIDHNTMIRRGETVEPFAGGELHYSGSNKREETYRILGLIEKEIVVLIRAENPITMLPIPSIEYHYYIPQKRPSSLQDMYSWKFPKFNMSSCYGRCNGLLRIDAFCLRNKDNVHVPDSHCKSISKPMVKTKPCASFCGYRWQSPSKELIRGVKETSCSVRCGEGHVVIHHQCQMRTDVTNDNSAWKPTEDGNCFLADLTERPFTNVPCIGECSPLLWSYGAWTNCTVGCGSGVRNRIATCKDIRGRSWNPEQCLKDLGGADEKEMCIAMTTCKDETRWAFTFWSQCSKPCGPGIQTREVVCVKRTHLIPFDEVSSEKSVFSSEKVSDSFCLSYSDLPDTSRPCMIVKCYKWTMDKGGKCSVTCGTGTRAYDYLCSQLSQSQVVVNDRHCIEIGLGRPALVTKPCDMGPCYTPRWIQLPWGQCSESCGKGIKIRRIKCGYVASHNKTVFLRNDRYCREESRPVVMRHCQDTPCSEWRYGPWSECQGKCLFGHKVRSVDCVDKYTAKVIQSSFCKKQPEINSRKCFISSLCGFWKIGDWSKCSVTCGLGTKTRTVQCFYTNGTRSLDNTICPNAIPFEEIHCENPICKSKAFWWLLKSSQCYSYGCNPGVLYSDIRCVNEAFEILQDNMCNERNHPNYNVGCVKEECRQYFWGAKPWTDIQCSSSSCMMTIRNRRVNCIDDYGHIDGNGRCDELSKLDDWRLCASPRNCSNVPRSCKELKKRHPESGDGEYSLAIDLNWTYFIFCADMKTDNPSEYVTLKRPNYSRTSKYTSMSDNVTCVQPGEYEDRSTCPGCQVDEELRSITYYNKIRVNLTDLSIDIYDNRYSTTIGSPFVPYGTAKDCSGSKTCPQGHFLIDLSNTEFAVSMQTAWNNIYNNFGYRIIRSKGSQIVKGWCGGECSGCAPLPSLYIEPQMYGRDFEVKSFK